MKLRESERERHHQKDGTSLMPLRNKEEKMKKGDYG
jgi:hypothetical protein